MQPELKTRLLHRLAQHPESSGLRPGDRVGVAVSGGSDSVALLRLLHEFSRELGIRLTVLHFNHRLRGAESEADERFVAALASGLGLPFLAAAEDVAAVARDRGWNLEDAGRRLRYAWFASLLDSGSVNSGTITKVAVAHTADDQAETVLARLIRGTGPAGLAAIYPCARLDPAATDGTNTAGTEVAAVAEPNLIRPLLGIRRAELRVYLESIGQPWREDPSNGDTERLRAHLRHEILPRIERDLQPAIVAHLGRLADMAREDEAFWQALVAERLAKFAQSQPGRVGIRTADLLLPLPGLGSEPARLAVTRRLVRGIVEQLRGDCRELTARHVEQVLRLAAPGASGRSTDLPGVTVERSFDWLWFLPTGGESRAGDYAHPIALESIPAPIGETVVVVPEISMRFRLKVIDWPYSRGENYQGHGVLDRDLLRSPLVLRSWRPGDSFQPRGRRSSQKLKQLLRGCRVALHDRSGWPVLTSDGELAWARGLPVAEKFAPGRATRAGVIIIEEP